MKPALTSYRWTGPVDRVWRFAVVSDLHNGRFDDFLPDLAGVDAILVPGDLVLRYGSRTDRAAEFLRAAPEVASTYYSIGNHERRLREPEAWLELARSSRAILLDNGFVRLGDDLLLGGFSSGRNVGIHPEIVGRMGRETGVKLLMCHHPEYYGEYVKGKGIDLTLSGHAHGGQVQLFGHGLYAPGQGILPKLTNGFYDDRHLLVSRGAANANHLPRWGNPCEVLLLTLSPAGEE